MKDNKSYGISSWESVVTYELGKQTWYMVVTSASSKLRQGQGEWKEEEGVGERESHKVN